MARKKKGQVREWLGDWTVIYEWDWKGKTFQSRKHDFRIKGSRRDSDWFMFNRHVTNNDNGAVWIDGFDPNGGFVSYRPEQVTGIRPHKEVKKDADQHGEQGQAPRKAGRKAKKP